MESRTIPPHKDSDSLSNHPIGEKNFLLPITKMKNTLVHRIFLYSQAPDRPSWRPGITDLDLLYFCRDSDRWIAHQRETPYWKTIR